MTTPSSDLYRAARTRLLDQIDGLDDGLAIPATPAWTLRDLLAHVVGVARDVAAGNVDEYAQPQWTDAQVASRAGVDRAALLAEWDAVTDRLTTVIDAPAAAGLDDMYRFAPVIDLVAHDYDIAEAAGAPVAPDDDAWTLIAPRRETMLALQIEMTGLPALEVSTPEGDHWLAGIGEPAGSVTVSRYELWRSLEGRRTRDAVRAFAWTTDPDPYLEVWPAFAFDWPADTTP